MKKIESNHISKWRIYGETMISQWIIVIIFLAYWFWTKRSFKDLFSFKNPIFSFQTEFLIALGLGVGLSIVMFVLIISFSKTIRKKVSEALTDESIQFLLPTTLGERLFFLLIAITAGVCEEIIFRGVMLYYLSHLQFELSIIVIGIISSLLFGIVHLYQGWKGVFLTSYLGAVLFFLFVGTGYLLVPIVLHFLIDAKFVFLPNKKTLKKNNSL
ncbi:CPBP family glutamic-type intramembrane protease [Oceanobacillus caeni]|uniref:CPBP family glutamic-type intramembrane protease n=1 Tax=Oceanobacillus caeni TaxID=405946 RepID=UPI0036384D71